MPVENTTVNRNYQLPDPSNLLSDDVLRLIAALQGVDTDTATVLTQLAGKAPAVHGHNISEITGLQTALDGKASATHGHNIGDVTGLQTALDAKAPLNDPAFTGTPTAPTQVAGNNSTRLATTAFVKSQTLDLTGDVTGSGSPNGGSIALTIAAGIVTFAKMATAALATASDYMSKAASKILTAAGVWDAAVPVAITYAATINFDFAAFINAKITATGNVTFGTTTNLKKGQTGIIEFTHSGAARTLSINSTYWKLASGFALSTSAGAVDYIAYYVCDDNKVLLSVVKL